MAIIMIVLVAQTSQQPLKTLNQWKMILDNHWISIREVADDAGISFGSWQTIFTDALNMKRVAAKIVPKLLNFEKKQRSMDITQ